jgi:hypothetical protein
MRLQSGEEALVARAVTKEGTAGYGFNFQLDATAARHMAEWHAGVRGEKPALEALLDHPWERAYLEKKPVPWEYEPGFAELRWLP